MMIKPFFFLYLTFFQQVSATEVVSWQQEKEGSFLQLIDVRGADFVGGSIPGKQLS